jgi:drug/metabolite transporter (DMT)-like permease
MKNTKALRSDALLLLTACIWGFGFVAQRSGMEYVGPFAYNAIRFLLGSLSLIPLIIYRNKRGSAEGKRAMLFLSSLVAGLCLFTAVMFQQFGMMFTTAGNAGFITGLYAVLTPIAGVFLGRKTGVFTWIGGLFTLTGLYFLSAAGSLTAINPGDVLIAVSALFWAFHVLMIDYLVSRNDPIKLAFGQFTVCGILCFPLAFLIEPHLGAFIGRVAPDLLARGAFAWQTLPVIVAELGEKSVSALVDMLTPIGYGGFASVGIAYTLQIVAQKDAPPAHATIILCFEGCFAALGGVLLLSEPIGHWTALGFALMLAGILITQWEVIVLGKGKSGGKI